MLRTLRSALVAACAALVAAGCASRPPTPEKLASMGTVAVVARLDPGLVSYMNEDELVRQILAPSVEAEVADRRLADVLLAIEEEFALRTRFRGELVDHLGSPPPFDIAPPGAVEALTGSLLVREEGPPSYKRLVDGGIEHVLELTVERLELTPPDGDTPAGLHVTATARLFQLPDQAQVWKSSVELVPEVGSALVVDPAELKKDPELAYREALSAAATAVGERLAVRFLGAPAMNEKPQVSAE